METLRTTHRQNTGFLFHSFKLLYPLTVPRTQDKCLEVPLGREGSGVLPR